MKKRKNIFSASRKILLVEKCKGVRLKKRQECFPINHRLLNDHLLDGYLAKKRILNERGYRKEIIDHTNDC